MSQDAKTAKELPVIEAAYEFAEWSCKISERFPKTRRQGLGARMENQLFFVMECLLEAKYCGNRDEKAEWLVRANMALTKYRFYARLARDVKCLSPKTHQEATRRAFEIGTQLHNWRSALRGSPVATKPNSPPRARPPSNFE